MKNQMVLLGLAVAVSACMTAHAQSGPLRPLDLNAAAQIGAGTREPSRPIQSSPAPVSVARPTSSGYQPVPVAPLRPISAVTPSNAAGYGPAVTRPDAVATTVASAPPALKPMPAMQPLKPLHTEAMPSPSSVLGGTLPATTSLPAGDRLSTALERYVRERGWDIRWKIDEDYVLDASLPIPTNDLIEAVTWVVHTYQSQGGMMGVVPRFARTNRVIVIEKMNVRDHY